MEDIMTSRTFNTQPSLAARGLRGRNSRAEGWVVPVELALQDS